MDDLANPPFLHRNDVAPDYEVDNLNRIGSTGATTIATPIRLGRSGTTPKKKPPVRNPWTKEDLRQLKAHSKKEDTPGGGRKGDKTNRGGGPAKGEDNRRRSWPSPLRTLALRHVSHT